MDKPMTWPLLELDATSPPDGPAVVMQALREALARSEPFAAVIRMPPSTQRERRIAGAVERVRMLKALRGGLADRCRGLAFVMPLEAQRDNAKLLRSGSKMWGCPTTATDDLAAARAWAREQLREGKA